MEAVDRIKEQIADNEKALPGLLERAVELNLQPQPWWDRKFYEYAIKRREAEIEKEGGEEL